MGLDLNVTKEILDCVIDDLDKQNKNPRKKTICGLKKHKFDMSEWGRNLTDFDEDDNEFNCGTTGCLWGTAYYKANKRLADCGPSQYWRFQSRWHETLYNLFYLASLDNKELVIAYRAIKEDGKIDLYKLKKLDLPVYNYVLRMI